ncbi:SecDF P1 head subdomain-containing protein [Myceligenerans crystallogenes]|uniref:SecDF P1 head subdomain domain-containing protein n=1 Tax=Myceligenerans crystallogenes TaxID=316335 RepID=A0ABN2NEI3_9MICO
MIRRTVSILMGCAVLLAASACGLTGGALEPDEPSTRIVLTAAPPNGTEATPEDMKAAADAFRARLEAGGRTVADATVDGSTVTLDVNGKVDDETRLLLTEPGVISFRQVLALGVSGTTASASALPDIPRDVIAGFDALDCTDEASHQADAAGSDEFLLVCDAAGTSKYVLGPPEIDGTDVAEANAGRQEGASSGWIVNLRFDDQGTTAFADIVDRLQAEDSPRNQFAITVDGAVISAPALMPGTAITSGEAQISGDFTRGSAEVLASQLGADPLPFPFEVQEISPQ